MIALERSPSAAAVLPDRIAAASTDEFSLPEAQLAGKESMAGEAGEAFKKTIPAGRFANPAQIATCALFLASDSARTAVTHHSIT